MNRINFKLFGGAAVLAVAGSLMFTQMAMAEDGTVKWYNPDKGFGFIQNDRGEEFYVHHSGLVGVVGVIQPGDWVSFDKKGGNKRIEATNVKRK